MHTRADSERLTALPYMFRVVIATSWCNIRHANFLARIFCFFVHLFTYFFWLLFLAFLTPVSAVLSENYSVCAISLTSFTTLA